MLDIFRRGRTLTLLAALAALLYVVSIYFATTAAGRAFAVAGILTSFVFVAAYISSEKKSEGVSKEAARRIGKTEEQLSNLVTQFESQMRDIETAPLRALSGMEDGSLHGTPSNSPNIFAPSTIPAARILGRPTAHSAGRLAAEQVMEQDGFIALNAMMNAEVESWTREISLIGSVELENALEKAGKVQRLVGPHQLVGFKAATSYLVIDENEFRAGPWKGLLSAQKTGLYLKLVEHITEAQRRGIVVVVRTSNLMSHFTNDLRGRANVVLNTPSSNWHWSDDLKSPVILALKQMDDTLNLQDLTKGES